MVTLRCIAVDDEPLALALLQDNISKLPYLQLVASCSNAMEAMKVLNEMPVDLMFIDIQMPGISGLQLVQTLVQKPMVILITAYKQYALESYNLSVVDYLVKPVALERFIAACNKALDLFRLKNSSTIDRTKPATYFFVNVDYSLLKIMFADIAWVEGLRDYIKIHLKSTSKPIVVRMSMKAVEEELPAADFIRIHKSYLVAIDSITAIKKTSVFINDLELPAGDTYRDAIDALTRK